MLRAFVLDDERLAVQRLRRMLESTGRVEVAGSATDPDAALAFLRSHEVDVLFLDIQMPGMSGFELIDRLEHAVSVVFTTAYDQYALNAFEVNSVDYLLKPIEPERLDRALDKVERFAGQPRPDVRALARELAAELAGLSGTGLDRKSGPDSTGTGLGRKPARDLSPLLRVASRVGERTTVLDVARISHFFAQDKLTFAVSGGREHIVDFTLAQLEERLDARRFARIHRATIVNVAFVHELYPGVEGVVVRLKDEKKTELSVSRDRVRELKERLGI
jgi:two-component system LytT family response regulator